VVDQAVSEEVVTREVRSQVVVSDDAIHTFYETNKQIFKEPELARLSHIFIATREFGGLPLNAEQKQLRKEKAQKLLDRARKGENFAQLAVDSSDDPVVKENKGEYKLARGKDDPRRAMVPEFEKAAFALKPGEISNIVTTEFGFHIIKMHEIVPARIQPLEEVRGRIRDHLMQVELEKRMTPYFANLKKEAAVEILDDRLRTALEKATAAEAQKTGGR
jgi:parvulin-like peptidyl-prolyl isomerase